MLCKNCGSQIAPGEVFCRGCGTAVNPQPQQQPQQGYAQQQYQQPQQGYAPQPNPYGYAPQYAPRAPKKPLSNEKFSLFWVLSALMSFLGFMFWYMPCVSGYGNSIDYSMASHCNTADDDYLVALIFAVLLGLAGTVISLLPIITKSVADPKWFWIPISTAVVALYNFIFTIVIGSAPLPADGIAFFGWIFMILSLGNIALNIILMGKSKRLF